MYVYTYIYIYTFEVYTVYIFISTYIFFKRKIKRMDQFFLKSIWRYMAEGVHVYLVIRQHSQCPHLRIEVM